MSELADKERRAIKILRMYRGDDPIEVSYSGGKDSDVILALTKMVGIPYRAIYKNTTIDPPYTVQHCKDNGVEVVMPKERFFDIITRKGIPTRRARFCCEVLKEYKILDNAVLFIENKVVYIHQLQHALRLAGVDKEINL